MVPAAKGDIGNDFLKRERVLHVVKLLQEFDPFETGQVSIGLWRGQAEPLREIADHRNDRSRPCVMGWAFGSDVQDVSALRGTRFHAYSFVCVPRYVLEGISGAAGGGIPGPPAAIPQIAQVNTAPLYFG